MKRLDTRRGPKAGHRARIVLDVECGKCGHVHPVTSEEVIRGTWRDCPKCAAPADTEPDDTDERETA